MLKIYKADLADAVKKKDTARITKLSKFVVDTSKQRAQIARELMKK